MQANLSGQIATFWVENLDGWSQQFDLSCSPTGSVSSCSVQAWITVDAFATEAVNVTYASGPGGTGTVTLTAAGTGGIGEGYYTVTVDGTIPDIQLLEPTTEVAVEFPTIKLGWCDNNALNAGSRWIKVNGVLKTSSFDYLTVGGGCAANATSTTTTVSIQLGSNEVQAHICDNVNNCATETFWVTRSNATAPPAADLTPYEFKLQDLARCALSCFHVVQTYTTVPHFTRGAAQAVTLVYHGDRANPRPIIQVDQAPPPDATPDLYQMKIKVNSVYQAFTNGETALNFDFRNETLRLKAQFSTNLVTGVYPMDIEIGAYYPATGVWSWRTTFTKLVVVNETTSPIARGWTVGGEQRLHIQGDGSALVTDGWGNAVYFEKLAGVFVRPPGEFSALTQSGSIYTRAYPDSTKVTFVAGVMTEIRDRFNQVWTFARDGSNRLIEIWDPVGSGRKHVLTYNTNGLATIVGAGSPARTTTLTVDGNKLLQTIQDPNGDVTRYWYAASGLGFRLDSVTDRRGFATAFEYDGAWRVNKIKAPTVAAYGVGNVRPETNFTPWPSVGLPLSGTGTPFSAARGDTIQAVVTDAEGRATKFTVDKWGQQLVVRDPLNNATTITRNADGLATQIGNPTGGLETMTYGVATLPLPTQTTATGSGTVNYRYAAYAQVDSVWGDTPPVRLMIGTEGRVDWVRRGSADSMKTSYAYKTAGIENGLLASVTAPNLVVTNQYRYDTDGNLLADSVPGVRRTVWVRDSYGRDTTLMKDDVRGQFPTQIMEPIKTVYDALNRVMSVSQGGPSFVTSYQYDGPHVKRVQDATGQVYRFAFNAAGWVTDAFDPADTLSRKDTYQYDRTGLRRQWINRRGQAITFSYDALGRLAKKAGSNTATDTLWYPDLLTTVARGAITTDSLAHTSGMLLSKAVTYYCEANCAASPFSGPRIERSYGYNARGELENMTPTGPTGLSLTGRSYAWTASTGRLASITLGGLATNYTFDRMGRLVKRTLPGTNHVVVHEWAQGGTKEIVGPGGYNAVVDRRMGRDPAARLLNHVKDDDKGPRYLYDDHGRLEGVEFIHVVNTGLCTEDEPWGGYECDPSAVVVDSSHTFNYDAVGNRWSQGGTYDPGNRVKTFGAWITFTHDLDGNVTKKTDGTTTYEYRWTAEGLLDSVQAGGTWSKLSYDGFGRFVGWNQGGTPVRRVAWDGGNVLVETNGTVTAEEGEYSYVPGQLDVLHAYMDGGGTEQHYAHHDGAGNVTATTTSGQVVRQSLGYDVWGKKISSSEPAGYEQRSWWKGATAFQRSGEFELTYMRARWYDPDLGRFLSEDPVGLEGGINRYSFAGNDPVNAADPTGLVCQSATEEYWVVNEEGNGLEKRTREVFACDVGISGDARWRSDRGWGLGGLGDGWGESSESGLGSDAGFFEETAVRFNRRWIGCRSRRMEFRTKDNYGAIGTWALERVTVKGPRVKIRGIPVDARVGFYKGHFKSASYAAPLAALGQVLCQAGVGLFEAAAMIS